MQLTPPSFRPVLERFAYFVDLTVIVFSIGAVWLGGIAGFLTGDFTTMAVALAGLLFGAWFHSFGYAHWHFRECEASLCVDSAAEASGNSEVMGADEREFSTLLKAYATNSDVWQRSEVRRTIWKCLDARPRLRAEFAEELAQHPDL